MRPPVSIIVPFHSGISFLKACIESLINSSRTDDEIIVVANNSDTSELNLPDFGERVHIHVVGRSIGHSGASNLGADIAHWEHLVFCDHDLIFKRHWIDQLWSTYTSDPQIAAVSCRILNPHSLAVLDFGIAFSPFNGAHPGMDLPVDHPLVTEDREAQAICTGGFLVSRQDFLKVGKFDECFGSLYTDLDICLRFKRMGMKVVACARALSFHFGGDFHLLGERKYKQQFLKADVKGVFMKNNADVLNVDLDMYYQMAIRHYTVANGSLRKYLDCNMMNVVDPGWYEELLVQGGANFYDKIRLPTQMRDAGTVGLFEHLGYDIMISNVPIAYFVDRFPSLRGNAYWWSRRQSRNDIVVDRNGSVLTTDYVLSW